jgi:hypothetical protein
MTGTKHMLIVIARTGTYSTGIVPQLYFTLQVFAVLFMESARSAHAKPGSFQLLNLTGWPERMEVDGTSQAIKKISHDEYVSDVYSSLSKF